MLSANRVLKKDGGGEHDADDNDENDNLNCLSVDAPESRERVLDLHAGGLFGRGSQEAVVRELERELKGTKSLPQISLMNSFLFLATRFQFSWGIL